MNIKRLKEIIQNMDDDLEVFIRNTNNPIGNISDLQQAEKSSYGFFGESIPCLILNTTHNMPIYETKEFLNGEIEEESIPDFIEKKINIQ